MKNFSRGVWFMCSFVLYLLLAYAFLWSLPVLARPVVVSGHHVVSHRYGHARGHVWRGRPAARYSRRRWGRQYRVPYVAPFAGYVLVPSQSYDSWDDGWQPPYQARPLVCISAVGQCPADPSAEYGDSCACAATGGGFAQGSVGY